MDFLKQLNPSEIAAWLQLAVIVVGLVAVLRQRWQEQVETKKLSRWEFIKGAVPEIHGVVQKIAAATKTTKDDAFVAQMDKLMRAMGMLPVQGEEVEAVKALGSGYHQEFKAMRDPVLPEELLPVDPPQEPAK